MRRALALLLLVAACGGGGGATRATLDIRDQAARYRPVRGAFRKATDGQDLTVGETVRTNGTGFVEIDYPDGSLARLDADASYTLRTLTSHGDAQRVRGHLDGGRMWSQVERITSSDGGYTVDTDVATASVRGTEFDIDCRDPAGSCTFTVADGTVTVDPTHDDPVLLHAGQHITVLADGTLDGRPGPAPDDPWIDRNLALDGGGAAPSTTSTTATAAGWRGTVTYEHQVDSSEPGGTHSERKRGTWVLDGTVGPDGVQPAHVTASGEERTHVDSGGGCAEGSTVTRQGDFDGEVDRAGGITLRDDGTGTTLLSLSLDVPPFPATERGEGCWTPSVDPKVVVQINLPEVPVEVGPARRVRGSWTDPNAGPGTVSRVTWDLTAPG